MTRIEKDSFSDYELSEHIRNALALLGYKEPTEIQTEVIPAMLGGNNVIAKAPTGSGKTAAFAIPLCEEIVWEENLPLALILEPTRELTDQVRDEVFHIGRMKRIKVPAVIGGFPIDKQIRTLKQKSHVVVGTPGRVMDHIRRDSLKLEKIRHLIIDEADLMLDMGFIDEVKAILALMPDECKISLFSATLKPEVQELVEGYMEDSVLIMQEVQEERANDIVQKLYETQEGQKYETFLNILIQEKPETCIIFCSTREMVKVLCYKLKRSHISCGMLHGEMEQRERLKTVDGFRRGRFRYLIATDVAARGIDFDNITLVVNYDFPVGRETYVHRIGRTGRNGRTGTAVSLICEQDLRKLKAVEDYLGQTLPLQPSPKVQESDRKRFWESQKDKIERKPQKEDALNQGIMRIAIGGGRKSKMRAGDIVGTICSIDGVEADDIGIIDIRDSLSYVEILNRKGNTVFKHLESNPIKGKMRKVRKVRHF